MTKIRIVKCYGDLQEWSWRPTAKTMEKLASEAKELGIDMEEELLRTAVRRFFGKGAFFWKNYELRNEGDYGQICEPLPRNLGGGYSCITGRIRIDIEGMAI